MEKIKAIFKREFIETQSKFDLAFLGVGLLLQVVGIIMSAVAGEPRLLITAISGITGVIAVVFCAQGRITSYIFNYTQLFTYMFGVCIPLALWGETIENVFYAVTMVWGFITWKKNYDPEHGRTKAKVFAAKDWVIWVGIFIIATVAFGLFLTKAHIIAPAIFPAADPQPWLDSVTTIAPFIGQILLCAGYREQWTFWIVEDIVSIVMFVMLGNWIMVAQYLFWTMNCVYGWYKWDKASR